MTRAEPIEQRRGDDLLGKPVLRGLRASRRDNEEHLPHVGLLPQQLLQEHLRQEPGRAGEHHRALAQERARMTHPARARSRPRRWTRDTSTPFRHAFPSAYLFRFVSSVLVQAGGRGTPPPASPIPARTTPSRITRTPARRACPPASNPRSRKARAEHSTAGFSRVRHKYSVESCACGAQNTDFGVSQTKRETRRRHRLLIFYDIRGFLWQTGWKIGWKIGWGDPNFHPILDPILAPQKPRIFKYCTRARRLRRSFPRSHGRGATELPCLTSRSSPR